MLYNFVQNTTNVQIIIQKKEEKKKCVHQMIKTLPGTL